MQNQCQENNIIKTCFVIVHEASTQYAYRNTIMFVMYRLDGGQSTTQTPVQKQIKKMLFMALIGCPVNTCMRARLNAHVCVDVCESR